MSVPRLPAHHGKPCSASRCHRGTGHYARPVASARSWRAATTSADASPIDASPCCRREKGVLEDVVRDAAAHADALRLVENPVDAQVDPALSVFILSLRERREAPRQKRPHVAIVILGDPVELIGHKGESDMVGAEV